VITPRTGTATFRAVYPATWADLAGIALIAAPLALQRMRVRRIATA